jgi:hypothetical protein
MTIYIPKHFAIEEFVPPEKFKLMGEAALTLMDSRILITADQLREFFDTTITINNYKWKGDRIYSGWRPQDCPEGAPNSAHKAGQAIDCIIHEINGEQARREIIKNRTKFPYITRMEKDVIWLHVDCKFTGQNEIHLFKP